MAEIEINEQFSQVLDFINKTSRSVFLTGKAGTGKTTLLRYIRRNTYKQMAVCAPTGVAAINAGGTTIHSFFQFPFSPFIPRVRGNGDIDPSAANLPALKYNAQRLSIFRNLELLVIDEISMVRADLLDQIDIALRYTRKRWQQPFGGVQLLLIGDMHQLPPVVPQDEWQLLAPHYRSLYFFDSHVITRHPPVYIELTRVYRQSDERFIGLLNKVRHNALDADAHETLNTRYRGDLDEKDYAQCVTLTTHNRKADEINARNLASLPGKPHVFGAEVDGVFPEKNYPAAERLELKVGARVMFLKNNPEKNYYNGKIGVVTAISDEAVRVRCEEDRDEINVVAENWNNVSYKVNRSTHHITEEVLGTFTQLPLRYAWAITIHKSQGLTFDRVIIDAAEAFSAGQVYVALSRCRSLEGLTLSSRIAKESLQNDDKIITYASANRNDKLDAVLMEARAAHLRSVLYGLFDLTAMTETRKELAALMQLHGKRIPSAGLQWLTGLFEKIDHVVGVAAKFREQLTGLAEATADPETDAALQERVKKASDWFGGELNAILGLLKNCTVSIEHKESAMEFNEVLQPFFENVFGSRELLKQTAKGFALDEYIKAKLRITYPALKVNVYANAANSRPLAGVEHPVLYRRLLLLRDEICNDEQMPVYMVAGSRTLADLAKYLPSTRDELLCINGFGKAKVEAFGDQFLEVIRQYREEQQIGQTEFLAPKAKKKKERAEKKASAQGAGNTARTGTRFVTLQLFKSGLSPAQIAAQRSLATDTILSHLVPFVASGELPLDAFVPSQKQELINKSLENFRPEQGLGYLKSRLPDEISFQDIRFVLAYREQQKLHESQQG